MSEEKIRPTPPERTVAELTNLFYSGGITRAEYEAVITPTVAPQKPGVPKP